MVTVLLIMVFWLTWISKLIVDAKDGCGQRQELSAHHQHSSRYVMVRAYDQGCESQSHCGKKTAYSHKFFMSTTLHNDHINTGMEQEQELLD